MSEWQEYRLDEIGKVVGGGTPSSTVETYWGGDVGWITPADLSGYKFKRIGNGSKNITELGLKNSSAKLHPKNTVLMTSRAPIGYLAIADKPVATNQGFQSIRCNEDIADYNFIYYLLSSYKEGIALIASGATFPEVSNGKLKQYKIKLPPLPTQKKIAKILSYYDDLIENNLKQMKLLEESAKLTYEEWFLRFRVDGKKLDIDIATGLPFGWEYKLMKDFGEVVTGKTPSTNNESFYNGDIPFVKTPSMHGNIYTLETQDYLTSLGANSQQNKFLPKNSLMVSCIGTAGVYSLVASNCQTNQQINSIKFYKNEYIFYIYGFAGHLTYLLDAIGSNGATMTNVNKAKFENIKVPMPSIDLLERFHNRVNPNFETILNIMKQNKLLKEARDILLPRLMTGMIDTDDMDIAV